MVHLGIIPDGNRRWCKINKEKIEKLPIIWRDFIIKNINELANLDIDNKYKELKNISEISIYIASIDNVNRNDKTKFILIQLFNEIKFIIDNPEKYLKKNVLEKIKEFFEHIELNIIGDIDILPEDIKLMIETQKNKCIGKKYKINLAIAYDYNKDILNETKKDNINYNRKQSNIDIVFRSGGEYRLSGFFPTKTIYSELFFLKKLWLDVNIYDIYNTLLEYKERDRRYGK